jgi:heme O synthase-like polyprenyltransferase
MTASSLVRSTTALKAQWLFAAAVVLLAALLVAMVVDRRRIGTGPALALKRM